MDVASAMLDNKVMSRDWVYENLFGLSPDQYNKEKDLMVSDAMQNFRVSQIENEGNDPSESGESYGTPHDLASLYGMGRTQSDPANVPDGYADDLELGRPKDGITKRGKQDSNFGKDPLGTKRMKDTDKNEGSGMSNLRESTSAQVTYLKNKDMFKSLNKKKLIFEEDKKASSLLDESQLKD